MSARRAGERSHRLRSALAALVFAAAASGATAEPWPGPIFDAHLHYNVEAFETYPVDAVFDRLRAAGVRAIVANSRPNAGTRRLAEATGSPRGRDVAVVPFVRLYRDRADYTGWPDDTSIETMVLAELAAGTPAGPYRGIGEFHLYDSRRADAPVARSLMRLAQSRGLVVLAHVDDDAIERLFAHAPKAIIIWAHTGIGGAPIERVRVLLDRHPTLIGELSYRPGLTESDGRLSAAWKQLLSERSDRFVVGSDTWVNARWESYGALIDATRQWLGELTPEAAERIAWGNAARLFSLPPRP